MNLTFPALWITALALTAASSAQSAPVIGAPTKAVSVGGSSKPKYTGPAPLALKQAIDVYFKQNLAFQGTLLGQVQAKINFRQSWRAFYFPTLKFTTGFTFDFIPFPK